MKNNLDIFETHDDVRRIIRRKKIKFFKVFKAVMIFLFFIGLIFIGLTTLYLKDWNEKQLNTIQASERTTIEINGKSAVMVENPDGSKSARVMIKQCIPLKFIDDCRNNNRIVSVNWSK